MSCRTPSPVIKIAALSIDFDYDVGPSRGPIPFAARPRMVKAASEPTLEQVVDLPAGRVREDGKLDFARKYDIDVGPDTQWWTGMIPLA